jgi:hypothetical protein
VIAALAIAAALTGPGQARQVCVPYADAASDRVWAAVYEDAVGFGGEPQRWVRCVFKAKGAGGFERGAYYLVDVRVDVDPDQASAPALYPGRPPRP